MSALGFRGDVAYVAFGPRITILHNDPKGFGTILPMNSKGIGALGHGGPFSI